MNFLHNQADPALPELNERLRNRSSSSATTCCERVLLANGPRRSVPVPAWQDAQRLVAQAGWRNENSVQNLAGLQQVVDAYENRQQRVPHRREALGASTTCPRSRPSC